jgi:hypothetical protein
MLSLTGALQVLLYIFLIEGSSFESFGVFLNNNLGFFHLKKKF